MKHPNTLLASLTLSTLLLAGCTMAASSGTSPAPASTAPSPTDASPPGGAAGSHNGHHSEEALSPSKTADGPSEASKMVCGDQPIDRLTAILGLKETPHTISDWADSTFTCTYHLNDGDLVISVREEKDQATALTYFDAMQALAKDATPIEGLANLGFPAYETRAGSAVFQKDSFVLNVDATNLPETLGPESITRNALAYQLSTTILACWVEHH